MGHHLTSRCSQIGKILLTAVKRFAEIDATGRAASFAYYAFFSIFPLLVLLVAVGSLFIERETAIRFVLTYVENYVPLEPAMQRTVFDTIEGVIDSRGRVGVIAAFVLVWGSLQFFRALVRGANRAWKAETLSWWQMPLKNLQLLLVLGSAVALGVAAPIVARIAVRWLPDFEGVVSWTVNTAIATVPVVVLFCGLSFFYRLAPKRTLRFADVWPAALLTALLLQVVESGFMLYVSHFGKFNAVYGAFGGIMALLMWIYLSGCVIVFGACVSAARDEVMHRTSG